jgi:hypothetical protein
MPSAMAKPAAMTKKTTAAAHWSPVVGGSEAAVEEMTRVASAERPANTSATMATPVQTPKETPAGVNGP